MYGHNVSARYTKIDHIIDQIYPPITILCECLETFTDTVEAPAEAQHQEHKRKTTTDS